MSLFYLTLPHFTSNWQYFTSSSSQISIIDVLDSSVSIPTPIHEPRASIPPHAPDAPPIRTSSRIKQKSSYLQDLICHASHNNHIIHLTSKYPLFDYHSYSHLSNSHSLFSLSIVTHVEPKTYVEAIKHDCWKQANQNELHALDQTGNWKIVDLPPGVKPIGCIWILKINHNVDGSIKRYKARFVAKGYNQI